MRLRYRAGLVGVVVATFAGCEPLFGLDGLTGGHQLDAGGGSGDASADTSVDVPVDGEDADAGEASPGSCDCLPSVPTGWDVVAFAASGAASCPPGYAGGTDVVVDPALGPATCTCTCAIGKQPSCEQGSITDTHSSVSDCADGGTHVLDAGGGACTAFAFGSLSAYHAVTAPPPSGGTCAPDVKTSLPSGGTTGRICALDDAGTCAAEGSACGPSVTAPFARCIARSGSLPCPTGFSVAHASGATIDDTRACGTCTCPAPSATCSGALSMFTDRACTSLAVSVPADGACQPTPGGASALAYTFTSTAQASCGPPATPPVPQGNASLVQPTTVCCR